MAAVNVTASTPEVALTGTTAKTVLQAIAASNHRVKINGWGVYFDGASSTAEPVVVRLVTQAGAIGGTPTSVTGRITNGKSETVQTTFAYSAGGSEPSTPVALKSVEVHPQAGYEEARPFGREYEISGGGRIGIECTAPANVNVVAWMDIEE